MNKETPFWWPDMQAIVVVTLMTLFVTAVMVLLIKPITITGEAGTLLTALLGVLTGKVATIVDFYFGTSKSNALKDQTSKSQAETISNITTPASTIEVKATETVKGP